MPCMHQFNVPPNPSGLFFSSILLDGFFFVFCFCFLFLFICLFQYFPLLDLINLLPASMYFLFVIYFIFVIIVTGYYYYYCCYYYNYDDDSFLIDWAGKDYGFLCYNCIALGMLRLDKEQNALPNRRNFG